MIVGAPFSHLQQEHLQQGSGTCGSDLSSERELYTSAQQQPALGLPPQPRGARPDQRAGHLPVRELALGFTVPKEASSGVLIPGGSTLLKKTPHGISEEFYSFF